MINLDVSQIVALKRQYRGERGVLQEIDRGCRQLKLPLSRSRMKESRVAIKPSDAFNRVCRGDKTYRVVRTKSSQ